uniref:Uncharacterized protein n=1 Tax=Picoa juniperi mycovirus 2 TaxID=2778519 RepID=A0A7L8Y999_9VIRU|nr:hypothetical protein [Picoa juniperi mycovirus 2]
MNGGFIISSICALAYTTMNSQSPPVPTSQVNQFVSAWPLFSDQDIRVTTSRDTSRRTKKCVNKYTSGYIRGRNAYQSRNFTGAYVSKQAHKPRTLPGAFVPNKRDNKGSCPMLKGTHYGGILLSEEQLARKEARRMESHAAYLVREARRQEIRAARALEIEQFNATLQRQQERYWARHFAPKIVAQISFRRADYIGWLFTSFPFSYISSIVGEDELECFYTRKIGEHFVRIPAPATNCTRRAKADNIGLTGVEKNPGPPTFIPYVAGPPVANFPSPWHVRDHSTVITEIKKSIDDLSLTVANVAHDLGDQINKLSDNLRSLRLEMSNIEATEKQVDEITRGLIDLSQEYHNDMTKVVDSLNHNVSHIKVIESALGMSNDLPLDIPVPPPAPKVELKYAETKSCLTTFIESVLECTPTHNELISQYNSLISSSTTHFPIVSFQVIFSAVDLATFSNFLNVLNDRFGVKIVFIYTDGTPQYTNPGNHIEFVPYTGVFHKDRFLREGVLTQYCLVHDLIHFLKHDSEGIFSRWNFYSLVNKLVEPDDSFAHEGTLRDRSSDQEQVAKITSTAVEELAGSRIVVSEFLYGADPPNINSTFSGARIPSTLLRIRPNLFDRLTVPDFGRASISSQFCLEYPDNSGRFSNSQSFSYTYHRFLFDIRVRDVRSNQLAPHDLFSSQLNIRPRIEADAELDFLQLISSNYENVKMFFLNQHSLTVDDMRNALSALSHNRFDSLRAYRSILAFESEIFVRFTSIRHFALNASRGQNYFRLFFNMWRWYLLRVIESCSIPAGISISFCNFSNDLSFDGHYRMTPWEEYGHNNPNMRNLSFIHLSSLIDTQAIPNVPVRHNLWPERDLFGRDSNGYATAGIGSLDPAIEFALPGNPRISSSVLADQLMSGDAVFIDASRLTDVQLRIILISYVQHNVSRTPLFSTRASHISDPAYQGIRDIHFSTYPDLYNEDVSQDNLYPTRFIIHWGNRYSISNAINHFDSYFLGMGTPDPTAIFLNYHPTRYEILACIREYTQQTHAGNDAIGAFDLLSSISNAYLSVDSPVVRPGAPVVPVSAFGVNGLMLPSARTSSGYFDSFVPDLPSEMMHDILEISVFEPYEQLHAFCYNVFCIASSINWPSFSLSCTGTLIQSFTGPNVNARFLQQLRDSIFYRRSDSLISPWMYYHRSACALMYMFAPRERTVLSVVNTLGSDYFALLPITQLNFSIYFVHPYNHLWMNDILPRHAFLPIKNTLPTWPADVRAEPLELVNPTLTPTVRVAADLDPFSGRAFVQGGGQCANLQYYVSVNAGFFPDQFGVNRPSFRGDAILSQFPNSYDLISFSAWNKPFQSEFPAPVNDFAPVFCAPIGSTDPLCHYVVPGMVHSFNVSQNRIRANGVKLFPTTDQNAVGNARAISSAWALMHQFKRQEFVSISYIPPPGFSFEMGPVNDFSLFVMRERSTGAFSGIYMGQSDAADFSHGTEIISKANALHFPSHLANAEPRSFFGKGGNGKGSGKGSGSGPNGSGPPDANVLRSRFGPVKPQINQQTFINEKPLHRDKNVRVSHFSINHDHISLPKPDVTKKDILTENTPNARNQLADAAAIVKIQEEINALTSRLATLQSQQPMTQQTQIISSPVQNILSPKVHNAHLIPKVISRSASAASNPYVNDIPITRSIAPDPSHIRNAAIASFISQYDNDNMNRTFNQPSAPTTQIKTRASKHVSTKPTPHSGNLRSAINAARADQVQAFIPTQQMKDTGGQNIASYRPTGAVYSGRSDMPAEIKETNDAQAAHIQLQGHHMQPIAPNIPGFSNTEGPVGVVDASNDSLFGHLNFSGR